MRTCTKCGEPKPEVEFNFTDKGKKKLRGDCKVCCEEYAAPLREVNREHKRGYDVAYRAAHQRNQFVYNLEHWYGLSFEAWGAMLVAQAGRCAACGDTLRSPAVDHDHQTSQVRGILCRHCNLALGHARENPERLRRLIAYLDGTCVIVPVVTGSLTQSTGTPETEVASPPPVT